MNDEVNILDTSKLRFEGDFDVQVRGILYFVRLTADKVHDLKHLFVDLERAFQNLALGCSIEPFGSVITGLGIRTSDVDCYVALPNGEQSNTSHVYRARNILSRYYKIFSQVIAITTAKVPIVKFFHIPTQRQCDVSFKSPAGVRNSKLIAFLLLWDKRALPLAILIKYWSKLQKFTGTNLMSNYSLTMMVIFFLQLKNILPPVHTLQRHLPSFDVDGWNTAFDESMTCSGTQNSESLYQLMGGFFKYYSEFNFKETIISPFLGREINKKRFDDFDLPEEFSLYKEHVTKDVRLKFNSDSKIIIQDPFDHSRNCSSGMFSRLADRIICHFQFASEKFEKEHRNNFLRAIFTQDPNSLPNAPGMKAPKHSSKNKIKKLNQQKKKGIRKLKTLTRGINNSIKNEDCKED